MKNARNVNYEFKKGTYVAPKMPLPYHRAYVSGTRHRQSLDIFWSREQFKNSEDLFETLSRRRSKDVSVDYCPDSLDTQIAFAEHRDLERSEVDEKDLERSQKASKASDVNELQTSRCEALFRGEAEATDKLEETFTHGLKDDFSDFKQVFERDHPELAKTLQAEVNALGRKPPLAEKKLNELLLEYVEMQLVQDGYFNAKYTLKDEALRREMGEAIVLQGKALDKLASRLLKNPEIKEALAHLPRSILGRGKHISELGGFAGIKANAKEGVFDPEARAAILSQVQQRYSSYKQSLSQRRSRGRSRGY